MHYLVTTDLTYVLSNATCYEKLLNKEICHTWTSPIPSARIFPISRATNLPNGSNLALNASPICLTISPLLGAGICKNVTSSSTFSFQLYLNSVWAIGYRKFTLISKEREKLTVIHVLAASLHACNPSS